MKTVEEINEKLVYLKLDILEFLGKVEMQIKYFLNYKKFKKLSADNIPKDTLYCYSGCRLCPDKCPYLDFSIINKENYCFYVHNFGFPLLNDECKICGISEDLEDSEDVEDN